MKEELLKDVYNIKNQETYTLPSKGIFYKSTDKISSTITLRRMTTKEDKIRLRNQTQPEIIKDLLNACIVDKDIEAGNLKLFDANYLLFQLRVLSLLDDTYKVALQCPFCSTEFIHEVNLTEVPINYAKKEDLKLLELQLKVSQDKIKLKIPTLNQIINMQKKLEEYFDQFPNADKVEKLSLAINAIYLDKVNGTDMSMTELAEEYITNLDIIDNRQLEKVISKLDTMFGISNNIKTKCPKCDREVLHGLPITNELFSPSED